MPIFKCFIGQHEWLLEGFSYRLANKCERIRSCSKPYGVDRVILNDSPDFHSGRKKQPNSDRSYAIEQQNVTIHHNEQLSMIEKNDIPLPRPKSFRYILIPHEKQVRNHDSWFALDDHLDLHRRLIILSSEDDWDCLPNTQPCYIDGNFQTYWTFEPKPSQLILSPWSHP